MHGGRVAAAAIAALLGVAGCADGSGAAARTSPTQISTTAQAVTSPPVLGTSWGPNQQGYGAVAPATVSNGGDPTGLVQHIRWTSWGRPKAVGHGVGWAPGKIDYASGHPTPVTLIATRLLNCNGTPMYAQLAWLEPHYSAYRPFGPKGACSHR